MTNLKISLLYLMVPVMFLALGTMFSWQYSQSQKAAAKAVIEDSGYIQVTVKDWRFIDQVFACRGDSLSLPWEGVINGRFVEGHVCASLFSAASVRVDRK